MVADQTHTKSSFDSPYMLQNSQMPTANISTNRADLAFVHAKRDWKQKFDDGLIPAEISNASDFFFFL
jgi:hypothetical protein